MKSCVARVFVAVWHCGIIASGLGYVVWNDAAKIVMVLNVVFYDDYNDIPLRGIVQTDSSMFAFCASILDDEPSEIAGRRGIYAQLRGFVCDDTLRLILEEKDSIFQKWRAAFDSGSVDTSTHPLYVDSRYKQLSIQADELFGCLGEPVIVSRGLMRVESGIFVFECLDKISL